MGMTKQEIKVAEQRLRSLVLDCMCASNESRRLFRRARALIEEGLAMDQTAFKRTKEAASAPE